MSVKFNINCSQAEGLSDNINKMEGSVASLRTRVVAVQRSLNNLGNMRSFAGVLDTIAEELDKEKKCLGKLETVLHMTVAQYKKTESKVKVVSAEHGSTEEEDGITEHQIDSIVYDDEGSYGGNQGSPKSERGEGSEQEELYEIVRNYYPDMTDAEISDYLKKLNSEGCGYVALVNTIFAEYEGREEEFEKDFGFPMYHDGDLNYDKLLVDLYTATDNHNKKSFLWFEWDSIDTKEDDSATSGNGTSADDREYRLQKYLEDKGVGMSMEQTKYKQDAITTENFMEYAEKGHIVISYRYGNLQKEDGTTAQFIDGGHAMVVTGVTDDGRFIVSSWGEKYYIDPSEIFTTTDSEGDSHTTNFEFQLIQYEENE